MKIRANFVFCSLLILAAAAPLTLVAQGGAVRVGDELTRL